MTGPTQLTSTAYDIVMRLADGSHVGLTLADDPEAGTPAYQAPSLVDAQADQRQGQNDWSFGLGHQDMEAEHPESALQVASMTNMALLQHRHAYLAPRIEPLQTDGDFTPDFFLVTSGSKILAFAGTGVYRWNTSSTKWELKDTMAGSISGQPVEFNTTVFVPLGSSTAYEYSTNAFESAGVASSLTDANASGFTVYHNDSNVPLLVKWDDTNEVKTNTAGINGGAQWGSATLISNTSASITWLLPMGGSAREDNLIVFKTDGRYSFDREGNVADENPDFRSAPFATLGTGAIVWRNQNALFPIRNRAIRWDPFGESEQETIYPPENAFGSRKNFGQPLFMAGDENYVYMVIQNLDDDYRILRGSPTGFRAQGVVSREQIWAWDWGIDLSSNTCDALAYVPETATGSANPWLLFRYGSEVRHIILPRKGLVAIQDSNTRYAETGELIGPWLDGGAADRDKAYKFMQMDGRDLSASSTITPGYSTDVTGEMEDLTFTALPPWADATTVYQQTVPASTVGRNIASRFSFQRGSGLPEETPVMRGYAWHAFYAGQKVQERRFTVLVDDGLLAQSNALDNQTGTYIRDALKSAWRQTQPVRIKVPEGDLVDSHVVSINPHPITVTSLGAPKFQQVIEVAMVDATESAGSGVIYDTGRRYDEGHVYGRAD